MNIHSFAPLRDYYILENAVIDKLLIVLQSMRAELKKKKHFSCLIL